MNRRDTLKKLMLSSGALISLPAWAKGWTEGDMICHQNSFIITEQETLAAVVDTIIPAGDSIGALSVGVDKFLQKLIDECYEKEIRENVKVQLLSLETAAQKIGGKSFSAYDQAERQQVLLRFSTSEDKNEKDFFDLMKNETIRGFNTSKEVSTNYLNYKVMPGHYYGCVAVKA